MKKAKDIMTPNPSVCLKTDTVYDAVRVMEEENCGAVPVVDESGRCVGIVTDRDICLTVILGEEPIEPSKISLSDVMSEEPVTCHPEDDLETVIHLMEENQVRRIPVVDQTGRCAGIIAQADIALEAESREEVCELVEEISK